MAPMVEGKSIFKRFFKMIKDLFAHPIQYFKTFFVDDWSKRTTILLYMESIESTLRIKRSIFGINKTSLEGGNAPTAFNPIAQNIAHKVEKIVNGKAMVIISETLFGIPSTAHILGGVCMGKTEKNGVIDQENRVFGYQNMLVCDGSMISANIGVNPSLSITAITERAMSKIQKKKV
jgi:cholesterol oxidase